MYVCSTECLFLLRWAKRGQQSWCLRNYASFPLYHQPQWSASSVNPQRRRRAETSSRWVKRQVYHRALLSRLVPLFPTQMFTSCISIFLYDWKQVTNQQQYQQVTTSLDWLQFTWNTMVISANNRLLACLHVWKLLAMACWLCLHWNTFLCSSLDFLPLLFLSLAWEYWIPKSQWALILLRH